MIAPPLAPTGSCALPVYWTDSGSQHPVDAGFLIYPNGAVTSSQTFSSSIGAAYYDFVVGRWLPVDSSAVSPDGLFFAYADYDIQQPPAAGMAGEGRPREAGALATTGRVYLVDAKNGSVRTLYTGSPTYAVAGFTLDGIYLTQILITMDGDFSSGLFRISPSGGTPVAVSGGGRVLDRSGWSIFNGAAWGTDYSTGGGIAPGNQLVELDLHTGAVTIWLTKPEGTAVELVGFDGAGNALVMAGPSGYSSTGSPPPTPPWQLIALSAPQQAASTLWQTTDTSASLPLGPAFVGPQGTWIGGQGGVWLDASGAVSSVALGVNTVVGVGNYCF